MGALMKYRKIIASVLEEYRELYMREEDQDVETTILQDDAHGEYRLVQIGWHGSKRISNTIFYLRLKNGKIHIEEDWTEEGVVMDFVQAGVPHYNLVLAFNPPFVRHLTEYAVS